MSATTYMNQVLTQTQPICPWCEQLFPPEGRMEHVRTCTAMPSDGPEKMQRAFNLIAKAFEAIGKRDHRKRESHAEYLAVGVIFGGDIYMSRLPRPLHYDRERRHDEEKLLNQLTNLKFPIFLRAMAYEALERRFPALSKTINEVGFKGDKDKEELWRLAMEWRERPSNYPPPDAAAPHTGRPPKQKEP